MAILSRVPVRERAAGDIEKAFPGRWLEVDLVDDELTLIGVYGPLKGESFNDFWALALRRVAEHRKLPVLLLGDLNTGESGFDAPRHIKNFFCSKHFAAIKATGLVDDGVSGTAVI